MVITLNKLGPYRFAVGHEIFSREITRDVLSLLFKQTGVLLQYIFGDV